LLNKIWIDPKKKDLPIYFKAKWWMGNNLDYHFELLTPASLTKPKNPTWEPPTDNKTWTDYIFNQTAIITVSIIAISIYFYFAFVKRKGNYLNQ
jgi:hypothetical protein